MIIDSVQLTLSDPVAAGAFFADVLGLPVEHLEHVDHLERVGPAVEVTVGRSRLVLRRASESPSEGVHHLAFDVPAETFAAHRDWLESRVPLLRDADDRVEFEGPQSWDSRSVYFAGPESVVLELIARRSRHLEVGPVPQLVAVTEVGVAVPDVPAAVAELQRRWGLPVHGSASAEFAPVGDDDGLLILVRPGRGWLPVFDVVAGVLLLDVRLTVPGGSGSLALSELATVVA